MMDLQLVINSYLICNESAKLDFIFLSIFNCLVGQSIIKCTVGINGNGLPEHFFLHRTICR
jgi:hypothetical protein